MSSQQKTKEACLARWRERSQARRDLALDLMSGRKNWNPRWPQWVVYELRAEITRILDDRLS